MSVAEAFAEHFTVDPTHKLLLEAWKQYCLEQPSITSPARHDTTP